MAGSCVEDCDSFLDDLQRGLPLGMPGDLLSIDDELEQYLQVPEQQNNEVLFVREHVGVWPTRSHHISGRLCLVKQHCVLFMAWLPYARGELQQDGSFKPDASYKSGDMEYAVLPLPLSEVRWLRPITPRSLLAGRGHRLEVGLVSGLTLPPLHFPPGSPSVHKFMDVVRKHVGLVPAHSGPDTWLVNAVPAPLARSLDALDLGDVMLGAPARAVTAGGGPAPLTWAPPPPPPTPVPSSSVTQGAGPGWASFSTWVTHAETMWDAFTLQPEPCSSSSCEASPNSLNGSPCSSAPRCSAEGNGRSSSKKPYDANPAFTSPSLSVLGRSAWHLVSQGVSKLAYSMGDWFTADWEVEVSGSSSTPPQQGEVTGAGLAALQGRTLQGVVEGVDQLWATPDTTLVVLSSVAERQQQGSEPVREEAALCAASAGGGAQDLAGAGQARAQAEGGPDADSDTDDDDYELVEASSQLEAALHGGPVTPPLGEQELRAVLTPEGRLYQLRWLQDRVWQGGVSPTARRQVWPLLLGLREPHHTHEQAQAGAAHRRDAYARLCKEWQAIGSSPPTAQHQAWWHSCSRVDKDVGRTDRSHPVFAEENGAAVRALRRMLLCYITQAGSREYCQGMSDLASPLLVVLGDEVEAFWALNKLLDHLGPNFAPQQEAMHAQLAALQHILQLVDPKLFEHLKSHGCEPYFFAFRWLLITFKRDFNFDSVLRVWEAIWCAPSSAHMHVYVAAAILMHYREAIFNQVQDFDGMLKFAIQLSGQLEAEPLLRLAGALAGLVDSKAQEVLAPLTPTRVFNP